MSNSGCRIGACAHGLTKETCVICLRDELERLRDDKPARKPNTRIQIRAVECPKTMQPGESIQVAGVRIRFPERTHIELAVVEGITVVHLDRMGGVRAKYGYDSCHWA